MLDSIKKYLYGAGLVVVLIIGGTIWYKISSKISNLEETVKTKTDELVTASNNIEDLKLRLALEKTNTDKLSKELDNINASATVLDNKIKEANQELIKWKNKPVEIKYVDKVKEIIVNKNNNVNDCNYGLELNKKISNLKYEEL